MCLIPCPAVLPQDCQRLIQEEIPAPSPALQVGHIDPEAIQRTRNAMIDDVADRFRIGVEDRNRGGLDDIFPVCASGNTPRGGNYVGNGNDSWSHLADSGKSLVRPTP